jgi:Na+/H+ antiporter NhaD/arsenite permease-like protein
VVDSTWDCVRGSNAYEIHVLIRISGTDGVKPYNILILFFSLAYMSITLDVTGILKAAAYGVSNISGNNGTKLFIYFYLLITALSGFFGNDPMILSGTLFLVYYTDAVKVCIRFVPITPLIFCSSTTCHGLCQNLPLLIRLA